YGRPVVIERDNLVVDGHRFVTLGKGKPGDLPWTALGVALVFECTGAFTRRQDLENHIRAGAQVVLLSAPSEREDMDTVVHGANLPAGGATIISCASCTTNCITP